MTRKPVFLGLLLIVVIAILAVFASSNVPEVVGDARAVTSATTQEVGHTTLDGFFRGMKNNPAGLDKLGGIEARIEMWVDVAGGTPEQAKLLRILFEIPERTSSSVSGELVPGGAIPEGSIAANHFAVTISADGGPGGPDYGETWGP